MQNRYAGDIGDFSKLGLMRRISETGLLIGLNWYLTPDETHSADGKFTQYLENPAFCDCDADLWRSLGKIVRDGHRNVDALEGAFPQLAVYYHNMLDFTETDRKTRIEVRSKWHENALKKLGECQIVFVDPDNGLMVPSAVNTGKSRKYALVEELSDYYRGGASVIYYQHKARRPNEFYTDQHRNLLVSESFPEATGFGLKFVPTSQRYYFFILQPQHERAILDSINRMMETKWKDFFHVVLMPGV